MLKQSVMMLILVTSAYTHAGPIFDKAYLSSGVSGEGSGFAVTTSEIGLRDDGRVYTRVESQNYCKAQWNRSCTSVSRGIYEIRTAVTITPTKETQQQYKDTVGIQAWTDVFYDYHLEFGIAPSAKVSARSEVRVDSNLDGKIEGNLRWSTYDNQHLLSDHYVDPDENSFSFVNSIRGSIDLSWRDAEGPELQNGRVIGTGAIGVSLKEETTLTFHMLTELRSFASVHSPGENIQYAYNKSYVYTDPFVYFNDEFKDMFTISWEPFETQINTVEYGSNPFPVPEPGPFALLCLGFITLRVFRKKR